MKKNTAIIIDDEPNNLKFLQALIRDNDLPLDVIAVTQSAAEGMELIRELKPQLVFLDIDMPVLSGFELLKKMEPVAFEVIFVTAYNQYAPEAFDYDAIAYITKPVITEKLKAAVEKALSRIREKKINSHLFSILEESLPAAHHDKIALPTMQGLRFVNAEMICYCESSGNYTFFFLTDNSRITVSRQLGEYEKLLPADTFVRIHDKYIINLHCIKEYIKGSGGEVKLENGVTLSVAARRKDELLSRFEKWLKRK